jgi:hypothetical protein
MAGLIVCALPYVFYNPMKSFVTLDNIMHKKDRNEAYFNPSALSGLKNVRDQLKNIQCHEVGLLVNEFIKEYPIWRVFDPASDGSMRLEHIEVNGLISPVEYPLGKFDPCAIISMAINLPDQGYKLGQSAYFKVYSQGKGGEETDIFVRVK